MPDIISVLPDAIANQIAAGEVIQRPASVVKELLENAVDAGADRIELFVRDAGRTLIHVVDNGKGMSPMDARLCWERHATSKIRKAEDLFSIRSFGFRGEALASIGAVAQVEMKTRQLKDETGTSIIIEGSEFKKQEPAVSPPGTAIAVKNLFFNIPARRNFLKSAQVELKHMVEEFMRVALPNPELAFSFTHNDNRLYNLLPGTQKQRIAELLNVPEASMLFAEEESPAGTFRIYAAMPSEARKSRGDQYFIVNGRFIRDPYLNHAITSVYADYLPPDHFPVYVVFIDMNPAKVDINVHPTKTEVKFEDEKTLYVLLKSVLKKTLAQQHLDGKTSGMFDDDSFASFLHGSRPEFPVEPKISVNPSYNPFGNSAYPKTANPNLGKWKELYEGLNPETESARRLNPGTISPAAGGKKSRVEYYTAGQLFQLFNCFVLIQSGDELLILDQELAHQRVLFERYLENMSHAHSYSQQLLFPRVVEFTHSSALLVEELLDDIRQLGFDINPFGQQSFIINGLPAEAEKAEAKSLLEGLIEEYRNTSGIDKSDRKAKLALALSKQSGIKRGRTLTQEEITHLVNDLMNCREPQVSPDGRPVFIRLNHQAIDKLFI